MGNQSKYPSTPNATTDAYIRNLLVTDAWRAPTLLAAIQSLVLPSGSCGLDAGCGIGLQSLLIAETIGAGGHVIGLDVSADLITFATEHSQQTEVASQTSFQVGSVSDLPFADDTFDWAWSADCIGYIPLAPLPLIKELARVVKPSGTVAILAWSSEKLLPGYPVLEARLNGTPAGIAPFTRERSPGTHFLRALGWLRDAGLKNVRASTFCGDAFAPLREDIRSALVNILKMRWHGVDAALTHVERAEYMRLCQETSPHFIVDQPDYYAFYTYSMFHGQVATLGSE